MIFPPRLHISQVDTTHYNLSELHYITLNHLYLLDYNYIVVPFPKGFVSTYLYMEGVQEVLTMVY
jgi:hypothetical protein